MPILAMTSACARKLPPGGLDGLDGIANADGHDGTIRRPPARRGSRSCGRSSSVAAAMTHVSTIKERRGRENVATTVDRYGKSDRGAARAAVSCWRHGLELLATAHWVSTREGATDDARTVDLVQAWSSRKKGLFNAGHVTAARHRLRDERWIDAAS